MLPILVNCVTMSNPTGFIEMTSDALLNGAVGPLHVVRCVPEEVYFKSTHAMCEWCKLMYHTGMLLGHLDLLYSCVAKSHLLPGSHMWNEPRCIHLLAALFGSDWGNAAALDKCHNVLFLCVYSPCSSFPNSFQK